MLLDEILGGCGLDCRVKELQRRAFGGVHTGPRLKLDETIGGDFGLPEGA